MEYEFFDSDEYSIPLELIFKDQVTFQEFSQCFNQAYLFSNENLTEYFSHVDVKNKKVATVGSSGDQVFNLLYYGCKDITLMDRSLFFEQFVELKKAAIKNLSYIEFMEYITGKIFDVKIYQKISHDLNKRAQVFWDFLFLNHDEIEHVIPNIFQHGGYCLNGAAGSEFYCKEESFNALKEILKSNDYKINYVTSDLSDFSQRLGNNQFDLIMLSNIYDHVSGNVFFKSVNSLLNNNLNENGKIQFLTFYKPDILIKQTNYFNEEIAKNAKCEFINIDYVPKVENDFFKRNQSLSEMNISSIEK
ncbi:MAG: DUF3419 family protein [Clostridia bacterium]|nr:DUF3419 family protein [Clostridia bacterium]